MEKIVVTYGDGVGKKGSVRLKPIAVENSVVPVMNIGDYYISRDIMNKLGLKDTDTVKVTFEKA
jgi:hypothetical protein